jgi:hypothetical protein
MDPRIYQAYKSPLKVRMQLCAADVNQGFPVVITGTINNEIAKRVQAEPEIYSAFATYTGFPELIAQSRAETQSNRRNLINLPNMAQNTLNYKGTIYGLEHIQICQTQQRNILSFSFGNQPASCVFSYKRKSSSSSPSPEGIFITVPLIEQESISDISLSTPMAQMFFTDLAAAAAQRPARPRIRSLQSIFNNIPINSYFYYSSCILTRSSPTATRSMSYMGLYFPLGWVLPKAIIELIGNYNYENSSRYAPFYIPNVMRQSYPIAKIQYNSNISPATYAANADTWSTNGQTYTQIISLNSDLFIKRIRVVAKGLIGIGSDGGAGQNRLKTTFEYQCLPLNAVKDVDGSNVLLDPATGKRSLADAITGTPEQAKDWNLTFKANTSGIETYAITAGAIAGVLFILIGCSFLFRYVMSRQGTPEGAAALASATAAVVGNNS